MLAGSIASTGTQYVVTLNAVVSDGGDSLAQEQARSIEQRNGCSVRWAIRIISKCTREAGRITGLDPEVRTRQFSKSLLPRSKL